jgi:hypothetical protein
VWEAHSSIDRRLTGERRSIFAAIGSVQSASQNRRSKAITVLRLSRPSLPAIIALVVLLVAAGGMFYIESRAQLEHIQQSQQNSDGRSKAWQERGHPTLPPSAVQGSIDAHNGEKDTHAVRWTDVIQALATVGSVVVAILIYLVYDRQREIMGRQADISATQAEAATIANTNVRAIERAFVFLNDIPEHLVHEIVSVGPEMRQGRPAAFFYEPIWENSGNTATKSMTVRLNWMTRDGELPDDFAYPYERPREVMFLGPKMRMPSSSIRISPDEIRRVGERSLHIYIWGRADYEDIFEAHHYTQFCYRLSVEVAEGNPFGWRHRTYYGPYNRTDQTDRTVAGEV